MGSILTNILSMFVQNPCTVFTKKIKIYVVYFFVTTS